MYDLIREWIQKNLDDPDIPWTDRQRAMLTGMSEYSETAADSIQDATDKMTNPGLQPTTELPELPDGSEENN